jgi:hypothetical protein
LPGAQRGEYTRRSVHVLRFPVFIGLPGDSAPCARRPAASGSDVTGCRDLRLPAQNSYRPLAQVAIPRRIRGRYTPAILSSSRQGAAMAVKWSKIAPYIENGFAAQGRVERASIVDAAYDEGADDDVVDALDGLGSRVFNSVDEAKDFLVGQGYAEA